MFTIRKQQEVHVHGAQLLGMPQKHWNASLEKHCPVSGDDYAKVQAWCEKPEGTLVLWGGYGQGKTYMCAAIANWLFDHAEQVELEGDSLNVCYHRCSNITMALRDESEYEIIGRVLKNCRGLQILDNIATDKKTQFFLAQTLNVVIDQGLPLILTFEESSFEAIIRTYGKDVAGSLGILEAQWIECTGGA